jgi:hypothetical protein
MRFYWGFGKSTSARCAKSAPWRAARPVEVEERMVLIGLDILFTPTEGSCLKMSHAPLISTTCLDTPTFTPMHQGAPGRNTAQQYFFAAVPPALATPLSANTYVDTIAGRRRNVLRRRPDATSQCRANPWTAFGLRIRATRMRVVGLQRQNGARFFNSKSTPAPARREFKIQNGRTPIYMPSL